ncbi:MAG TPA: hypothetical protein VH835_17955 [Dongiaceae bacterium]|jgi:hypothetical protein
MEGESTALALLTEQIILIATVIGTAAALPTLIEFWIDRRKRRERIALSLDDLDVAETDAPLAGLDDLLSDIADLIDRARHPEAYSALKVGNEILIIGPNLCGKKALALRIAKDAGMDRLIVVYNPRSADALAKAKSLIRHYRRRKVMLLLPRLDHVAEHEDDEVFAELDALIDTTSSLSNVLVVGTAVRFEPNGLLDNMFGIVLALPGTPLATNAGGCDIADDARRVLREVAQFNLRQATAGGFRLSGIEEPAAVQRIAQAARNPADVEDIVVLCQTTALFRRRTGAAAAPEITADIIEKSIRRVIVTQA